MSKSERLSCRISSKLKKQLSIVAAREFISESALVNQILSKYLFDAVGGTNNVVVPSKKKVVYKRKKQQHRNIEAEPMRETSEYLRKKQEDYDKEHPMGIY